MAVWNTTFESEPSGNDAISDGDNKIRATRLETRVRASKEHAWGLSGPDDGYHVEGSARAFFVDVDPTSLNTAADTTGGGGAVPNAANSSGRLTVKTVSGHYRPLVFDGTAWVEIRTLPISSIANTTNSSQFTTTASFLQDTAGSADFKREIIVPTQATWAIYVWARTSVKCNTNGATAVVQLCSDIGGAVTVLDQTSVSTDNNRVSNITFAYMLPGVGSSLTYRFRLRGMTNTGNYRWNEAGTNPAAVEFTTPYTQMQAFLIHQG